MSVLGRSRAIGMCMVLAAVGCDSRFRFDPAPAWGGSPALDDAGMTTIAPPPPCVDEPAGCAVGRVFLGAEHSCAELQDGIAYCWGRNDHGQVAPQLAPGPDVHVPQALPWVVEELAPGTVHSCALHNTALTCWGLNRHAVLGVSDVEAHTGDPELSPSSGPRIDRLRVGTAHTCLCYGVSSASLSWIQCFGDNSESQAAWRDTDEPVDSAPPYVTTPSDVERCSDVSPDRFQAAGARTCFFNPGGVDCYGAGASPGEPLHFAAGPGTEPAGALAIGPQHVCIAQGGAVQCAGDDDRGQLGDGAPGERDRMELRPVDGLDGTVVSLAAGGAWDAEPVNRATLALLPRGSGHNCVATEAGEVFCWGANDRGQLGDGTQIDRSRPVRVEGLGAVSEVRAGGEHTCARTTDGRLWCWGDNRRGQLGAAPHELQLSTAPRRVLGPQ